jgi:hypothetical protein
MRAHLTLITLTLLTGCAHRQVESTSREPAYISLQKWKLDEQRRIMDYINAEQAKILNAYKAENDAIIENKYSEPTLIAIRQNKECLDGKRPRDSVCPSLPWIITQLTAEDEQRANAKFREIDSRYDQKFAALEAKVDELSAKLDAVGSSSYEPAYSRSYNAIDTGYGHKTPSPNLFMEPRPGTNITTYSGGAWSGTQRGPGGTTTYCNGGNGSVTCY